jgi:putative ABC transport system permease protein
MEKKIALDRRSFRVVGVMPEHFAFPGREVDLWIPWGYEGHSSVPPRDQHHVSGLGRIKPGVSLRQASADLESVAAELARTYPETKQGWSVRLVPLHEEMLGAARLSLVVLTGAVAFLFLMATINVAGLELVRATGRVRENALRSALGASSGRLTRLRLVESFLTAALAAGLGHFLAWSAIRVLKAAPPTGIPRLEEVALGPSALVFTFALALFAALTLAAAPAVVLGRVNAAESLREARSGTAGRAQRFRSGLVVAQVGTAVILLLGAGLLVRSFFRLLSVNPGFEAENVLVLPMALDKLQYGSGAKVRAYYGALTEKLASLPGVVSVGGASALPASPLGPDFERPDSRPFGYRLSPASPSPSPAWVSPG